MKLSVIIPTLNRSSLLNKTLFSITKQTLSHSDFEVLVIDNGSKDDTKSVVLSYKDKIKNIRYIYEDKPGLHNGRHRGLQEAQSEILVYGDDDIEAFETWLEGIYESFTNKDVVLVGGKNLPNWEIAPPKWIRMFWDKKHKYGKSFGYLSILDFGNKIKYIDPKYVWGCNFSIRKKTLLDAGGFHPDSMPGELLRFRGDGESYISRYISENGLKSEYNPKASIYHYVPAQRMTKEYLFKRAYRQGISDSYTKIRQAHFGQ